MSRTASEGRRVVVLPDPHRDPSTFRSVVEQEIQATHSIAAGKANLVGGNDFSGDQAGAFLDRGGAVYNSLLYDSLADMVAEIGANEATILLAPGDTKTLTGNLTIPENITVLAEGGLVTLAGFVLTINGPLVTDGRQVFDLSGGGSVAGLSVATPAMFGAAGDGTADDFAALNALAVMSNNGRVGEIRLGAGTYRYTTGAWTFSAGEVHIKGDRTTIFKDHGSVGIRIRPTSVYTGTVDAASSGASTVTVQGSPGFTTDEWAGHFVEIATEFDGNPTLVRRRIISNTEDTLTLDYGVGCDIAAADPVTIYGRITNVTISDLTVEGSGGSAGINIEMVENVELRNVRSRGHNGNAITVNTAARVRMWDCEGADSQFAIFVYNSDDVKLIGCVGRNAGGHTHTIQLKDCRNAVALGCTVFGGPNNGPGCRGIDVKCSGLNPSFNSHIIGCDVYGVTGAGIEAYSLQNEGDAFHLENATINGRVRAGVNVPETGFRLLNQTTARMKNVRAYGIQSFGCASGLALRTAIDVEVSDFTFENSTGRAINVDLNSARVRISNGVVRNSNYGGPNGYEIRITDGVDCLVENVLCSHTDANSNTVGFIQEVSSASRNRYEGCSVQDVVGGIVVDYNLLGTDSYVSETPRTQSIEYAPSIQVDAGLGSLVKVGVLTGNIGVGSPSRPARGRRLTFVFTQDGTGGRTITFNSVFKVNWTPDTSANAMNIITFEYDGTNWVQQSAAVGL